MKKWFILILISFLAALVVQAKPATGMSIAAYMKKLKEIDTDGDGILSKEEQAAYKKKGSSSKPKSKPKSKETSDDEVESTSWNKKKFLRMSKKWAKDGDWDFDPDKAEESFEETDTDGDGLVSKYERLIAKPTTWDKKKYIRMNKKWAKHPDHGWKFNQKKTAAAFDAIDVNEDGFVTEEEKKDYRALQDDDDYDDE